MPPATSADASEGGGDPSASSAATGSDGGAAAAGAAAAPSVPASLFSAGGMPSWLEWDASHRDRDAVAAALEGISSTGAGGRGGGGAAGGTARSTSTTTAATADAAAAVAAAGSFEAGMGGLGTRSWGAVGGEGEGGGRAERDAVAMAAAAAAAAPEHTGSDAAGDGEEIRKQRVMRRGDTYWGDISASNEANKRATGRGGSSARDAADAHAAAASRVSAASSQIGNRFAAAVGFRNQVDLNSVAGLKHGPMIVPSEGGTAAARDAARSLQAQAGGRLTSTRGTGAAGEGARGGDEFDFGTDYFGSGFHGGSGGRAGGAGEDYPSEIPESEEEQLMLAISLSLRGDCSGGSGSGVDSTAAAATTPTPAPAPRVGRNIANAAAIVSSEVEAEALSSSSPSPFAAAAASSADTAWGGGGGREASARGGIDTANPAGPVAASDLPWTAMHRSAGRSVGGGGVGVGSGAHASRSELSGWALRDRARIGAGEHAEGARGVAEAVRNMTVSHAVSVLCFLFELLLCGLFHVRICFVRFLWFNGLTRASFPPPPRAVGSRWGIPSPSPTPSSLHHRMPQR